MTALNVKHKRKTWLQVLTLIFFFLEKVIVAHLGDVEGSYQLDFFLECRALVLLVY